MEKFEQYNAKGIILGGFITNGFKQLGISVVFFMLTGLTYYGVTLMMTASWSYYFMYGLMFLLAAIAFRFVFIGLDYFYQMRRFLLYPEIKVNVNQKKVKTMSEVLEHIKINEIIYASKKVVVTDDYLIVLKDEPSIFSLSKIQAINKSTKLEKEKSRKGSALITLNFYNYTKEITFESVQEADLFMEVMNQVQKA